MRDILRKVNLLGLALLLAVIAAAHPAAASSLDITAKSAVVMDADTGRVIISKDMNRVLPPASTTKVASVLVGLENAALSDEFGVSKKACDRCPTKVNLMRGDRITVEALLYAMLIKSANDAATALAEGVAGTESAFARMMTDRARELGAVNTTFKNASGLPEKGHHSTAYDMALIFREAVKNERFVEIASTRYATLNMGKKDVLLKNSNKLLWTYEGAVAGKTGYTRAARDCYVGEVDRGGTRLIVSVMGSEERWDDVRKLLDAGFDVAGTGETVELTGTGRTVVKKADPEQECDGSE